jgi:hypothetical protein
MAKLHFGDRRIMAIVVRLATIENTNKTQPKRQTRCTPRDKWDRQITFNALLKQALHQQR